MIKGIHHISMKCQNEEEYSQDRKWFTFVNKIVKEVETGKVLTKDKNAGDKIDALASTVGTGSGLVYFPQLPQKQGYAVNLP